ncbi:ABC transporter substrate-binding protein [Bosea sp. BH3]|uniref:ABC transporter substrate-binding protein n=1 Tax=Bosea sp. BH3 TaxID=2871701 RepID=UPI0021CB360A|nr:ABC transporter substrate-binding protein [Bosea sp. BH3]MCU4178343.1 ABC transporter substrate-binding protein [Bosea sp. BH3]
MPAIHGARAAEPVKIRFAWSTMPTHLVPAIFKTPVLKHHGKSYIAEPQNFSASTPMITAFAASQIDVGVFAPTALALAITNARVDIKVIADSLQDGRGGYRSQTLYVKANSGIKDVTDLKGKKIGVNGIGSASYTSIVAMLRKHKMDEKRDVSFVEVTFSNMLPMIEDDKIDATTIQMPMAEQLVKEGKYRGLFTSFDAMGPTVYNFLAARTAFLTANRAAVVDMLEDYIRALRWLSDPANKTEALRIIAAESKRTPESIGYLLTKDDYYRDPNMVPDIEGIQKTIDITNDLGFLAKRIEVASYADTSYVAEAAKRAAVAG